MNPHRLALIVTQLFAVLVLAPDAQASIGFLLNLTATESNPDFGTGVTVGDTFTGMMFFDEGDLFPDGIRSRTVLPGDDYLEIAGVSFDSLLDDLFWSFSFIGGQPACFATVAEGCDGMQSMFPPDGPGIGFGSMLEASNGDDLWADDGGANHILLTYTITPVPTKIPTVSEWGLIIMALLALTAGTIVFGRRRRPAVA